MLGDPFARVMLAPPQSWIGTRLFRLVLRLQVGDPQEEMAQLIAERPEWRHRQWNAKRAQACARRILQL
jgi:hypothetical protein